MEAEERKKERKKEAYGIEKLEDMKFRQKNICEYESEREREREREREKQNTQDLLTSKRCNDFSISSKFNPKP